MNWCILIPLLVGIICAILGYLIGRLLSKGNHDACHDKTTRLEAELKACKKSRLSIEKDLELSKASLSIMPLESSFQAKVDETSGISNTSAAFNASVGLIPFDAAAAKAVYGKKIKENDLKVVEGIGPKIQELFHSHGINTWKLLSECSIEKCEEVLKSGGERYRLHKPNTWPKQAELAYKGEWSALLKWQDELDGGKS